MRFVVFLCARREFLSRFFSIHISFFLILFKHEYRTHSNILKANLCFTHGIGHYLTFVFIFFFCCILRFIRKLLLLFGCIEINASGLWLLLIRRCSQTSIFGYECVAKTSLLSLMRPVCIAINYTTQKRHSNRLCALGPCQHFFLVHTNTTFNRIRNECGLNRSVAMSFVCIFSFDSKAIKMKSNHFFSNDNFKLETNNCIHL